MSVRSQPTPRNACGGCNPAHNVGVAVRRRMHERACVCAHRRAHTSRSRLPSLFLESTREELAPTAEALDALETASSGAQSVVLLIATAGGAPLSAAIAGLPPLKPPPYAGRALPFVGHALYFARGPVSSRVAQPWFACVAWLPQRARLLPHGTCNMAAAALKLLHGCRCMAAAAWPLLHGRCCMQSS